jgi:Immunity protein 22
MTRTVDIWVGNFKSKRAFNSFTKEHYGEDDQPINQFAASQGETFYDHDFTEIEHFGKNLRLAPIIEPLSDSNSFLSSVLSEAHRTGGLALNCVFADYDQQFENPVSVEGEGFSIVYMGRFEFSDARTTNKGPRVLQESDLDEIEIYLKVVTGDLVVNGEHLSRITIKASRGLIIGTGEPPLDRDFLDLGAQVPGIASRQVDIRFPFEKEYWELKDLASNGITFYGGEEFDGATAAPFNGIKISFGDIEFEWSLLG